MRGERIAEPVAHVQRQERQNALKREEAEEAVRPRIPQRRSRVDEDADGGEGEEDGGERGMVAFESFAGPV